MFAVVPIKREDDELVVALVRGAWAARVDPRSSGHRYSLHDLRSERIRGAVPHGVYLNETLVGCVVLLPIDDRLHVESLAANPDHAGSGIGAALLDQARRLATRLHRDYITLDVSILQPDILRWYASQGFVVTPEHSGVTGSGRPSIAMAQRADGTALPDPVGEAVSALKIGALIGLPTETVYGLAADAANPVAVRRIFAAKGRPADHPLIVHLARGAQLDNWAIDVPDEARELAAALWPGPLTIVLRRAPHVLDEVTGGRDTVALRVPGHPLALAVLGLHGGGLAAPSANRFGRVSPTTAADVRADLGPLVDLVLDGGPSTIGVESTIIDLAHPEDPQILRPGGTPIEAIEEVLGRTVRREPTGPSRAPGMLASHYAPLAAVELLRHREELDAAVARWTGRRVRIVEEPDPDRLAPVLYERLRAADRDGIEVLLVVEPDGTATGLGPAVLDRLRRAATARLAEERPHPWQS